MTMRNSPSYVRHFRIFVSSPGDVVEERRLAREVIESVLPQRPALRGKASFEVVAWDHPEGDVPMSAGLTPQEAINLGLAKPSDCDLTIVILWGRMGSPLPDDYLKPDGSRYLSGTEWEYEDARRRNPATVFIYRRTTAPILQRGDPNELHQMAEQAERLQDFFESFRQSDGSYTGSVNTYDTPEDFREKLSRHLELIVLRYLTQINRRISEELLQGNNQLDPENRHLKTDQVEYYKESHVPNNLKDFWKDIPSINKIHLLWIFALSTLCIVLSVAFPNPLFIIFTRPFGIILILYALFYIAFDFSSTYLDRGKDYIHHGMLSGGINIIIGAIFYSLCLYVLPSSDCNNNYIDNSINTAKIFEKFGRFIFIGYPIIIGFSLVFCSIQHLLNNPKNNYKNPPAVFTIILVFIELIILTWVSSNIKELGLANEGSNMGDIDMLTHVGLTFLLSMLGVISIFKIESAWKGWFTIGRPITVLVQPIMIIIYTLFVYISYGRPKSYLADGTGIGVIVFFLLLGISMLLLGTFATRKILPPYH